MTREEFNKFIRDTEYGECNECKRCPCAGSGEPCYFEVSDEVWDKYSDNKADLASEKRELYLKAVDSFGLDAQVNMAIEEMAELIVALRHMGRGRKHNVEEEMADVSIMLDQLIVSFDEKAFLDHKKEKLERLESILNLTHDS